MSRAEDDYPDIHLLPRYREDYAVQAITKPHERSDVTERNKRSISIVSGMPEIGGGHVQPKSSLWSDKAVDDADVRHIHITESIGTLYRSDILGGRHRPHF